jgi:very-short-patch-repair endonuclease
MTESEKILWEKLSGKKLEGFRFRRQHPIGRYIADFYNHEKKLIIEIDGDIHGKQKEYDKNRDRHLKAHGYTLIRIKNEEIKNNIESVINTIRNLIL